MKKMVIMALLAASASFAQAIDNSAQAWEFRREECRFVAERAAAAYDMHINGKDFFVPENAKNSANGAIYEWTNEFAQGRINGGAQSRENAVRVSYAKCLDNIDSAFLTARDGGHVTLDQLR